ncbi:MAG: SMC-Scp complex subunit ScpB [Candidatus Pacearchaeota archaeon]
MEEKKKEKEESTKEEAKKEIEKGKIEIDEIREKEYLRKLEAALFVSARWLSIQELVMLTNINPILLKILLAKLKEEYEKEDRAIIILQRNDLWKMDVKQEYQKITEKLVSGSSEFSKAEQATLALIAYKQPIKQSVVVKIRGNKAYDHIKKFLQLNLIKSKKLGHTLELSLNEEFYNYFSINPNDVGEGEIREIKEIKKE